MSAHRAIPGLIKTRGDLLACLRAHKEDGCSFRILETKGIPTPETARVELLRAGYEVSRTGVSSLVRRVVSTTLLDRHRE